MRTTTSQRWSGSSKVAPRFAVAGMAIAALLMSSRLGLSQTATGKPEPDLANNWALAASLFSTSGSEIAVSKNLSSNTMLLMLVDVSWSNSDSDENRDELQSIVDSRSEQELESFNFNVGPELRKYYYREPALAFYFGIQPTVGYNKGQSRYAYINQGGPTSSQETETRTKSIGASLSLGAEYHVLEHMSVSVHFRPLSYRYAQVKRDGRMTSETTVTEISGDETLQLVAFGQNTRLFVRIYF